MVPDLGDRNGVWPPIDPRGYKSWARRTAFDPSASQPVAIEFGLSRAAPVRSADEPEDGADDRAEDGGPYESLHGTGFGYDYLAPVC